MYDNVELRKLPAGLLCNVINILETNDDWKKVMSFIPKDPRNKDAGLKYNNEHIKLIEDHAKSTNQKCAEILFDEWSTSGSNRPTLSTVKEVVIKAGIYRAGDEIAKILQQSLPIRPRGGPEEYINTNLSDLSLESKLNAMTTNLENMNFPSFNKESINSNDRFICNKTTKRISRDGAIINSNNTELNIPNISALQSVGDKTTTKLEESDLIKFSATLSQEQYIPDISMLLNNPAAKSENQMQSENIISTFQSEHSNLVLPNISQTSMTNLNLFSGLDPLILQDPSLIHFDYEELEKMTNKFSESLESSPKGLIGKIGMGGFAEVFVGSHHKYGTVAIKKAHQHFPFNLVMKVFNSEVKCLLQFRHKNIVLLIGYSKNGPALCTVCEYVDGGSLEQKIAEKVLTEKQRLYILTGTAEGIKYVHTSEKPIVSVSNDLLYRENDSDSQNSSRRNNFVHGDVKSANILLTKDLVPKLCDFGLAKQYDKTVVTNAPMGTSAYMAPEGFSGTITQKIDIYSFGIVTLELLTGLKPIVNENNEQINIKNYVEENCTDNNITNLLDPVVKNWTVANKLYDQAKCCLRRERKSRPSIDEICNVLNDVYESVCKS